MVIATPIGSGCRVEGPHGPVACGKDADVLDGSVCSCGCSAFEDACPTYVQWYREKYNLPIEREL